MIYGGGGGAVIHRFFKKINICYLCNPISPPNFEYIKQYKYVSEKKLPVIFSVTTGVKKILMI